MTIQDILEDIEDAVDLELEPPEGPYVPMAVVRREADGCSPITAWRELVFYNYSN